MKYRSLCNCATRAEASLQYLEMLLAILPGQCEYFLRIVPSTPRAAPNGSCGSAL